MRSNEETAKTHEECIPNSPENQGVDGSSRKMSHRTRAGGNGSADLSAAAV